MTPSAENKHKRNKEIVILTCLLYDLSGGKNYPNNGVVKTTSPHVTKHVYILQLSTTQHAHVTLSVFQ